MHTGHGHGGQLFGPFGPSVVSSGSGVVSDAGGVGSMHVGLFAPLEQQKKFWALFAQQYGNVWSPCPFVQSGGLGASPTGPSGLFGSLGSSGQLGPPHGGGQIGKHGGRGGGHGGGQRQAQGIIGIHCLAHPHELEHPIPPNCPPIPPKPPIP